MAERTLQYPPATHVHLADSYVHRIDMLTLEQAREVIVWLCDQLEIERHKQDTSDGFRPSV